MLQDVPCNAHPAPVATVNRKRQRTTGWLHSTRCPGGATMTSGKPLPRPGASLSVWGVCTVLVCAILFAQPWGPGSRLGPLPPAPSKPDRTLETESYIREPVSFECSREKCAAWLYLPKPKQPPNHMPPVVVMGHGMGLYREAGLHAPAEALAQAGFAVFAIDYRTWGASGGLPRQVVSVTRNIEDFHSAITHVQSHLSDRVNATNISLWGFSLGGTTVLRVAAELSSNVTAVVAVAPAIGTRDIVLYFARTRPLPFIKLLLSGAQDNLRSWFRLPPVYVPLCGSPHATTILGSIPQDIQRYEAIIPAEDRQVRWWNLWRPSYYFDMMHHAMEAYKNVAHMQTPFLLQAMPEDRWCPLFVIQSATINAPNSVTFQAHPGDHFDYARPAALEAQVAFLRQHAMA